MKTIFRWIWFLTGCCVAVQYAYWGVQAGGAWLANWTPPVITNDWLALAMLLAACSTGERLGKQLLKLLGDKA